jgi:hypothetical protein
MCCLYCRWSAKKSDTTCDIEQEDWPSFGWIEDDLVRRTYLNSASADKIRNKFLIYAVAGGQLGWVFALRRRVNRTAFSVC